MAIERHEVYPVPHLPRVGADGHLMEQPATRTTWPAEVEVWVAPLGTPLPLDLAEPPLADGWSLLGKTAQNGCEAFHDGWGRYEIAATCTHVSVDPGRPWRAADAKLTAFAVVLRSVFDQATVEWQFPQVFLNAPPVQRLGDPDTYTIEFVPMHDGGGGPVWVILSNAEADH